MGSSARTRKNAPEPLNAECFDSSCKQKRKYKKETAEEISANDECDQDSSISFDDDEENTTSHEDILEDWIEYEQRSMR